MHILSPIKMVERAKTAAELGESHFREFKSGLEGPPSQKKPRPIKDIATNIAQTLVAFANADGGELLVGVEDNGVVTGMNDFSDDHLQALEEASITRIHPDTPLSSVRKTRVNIDGKLVLYFSVSKSVEFVHVTSDGRCLQRRDLESVPVSSESIHFDRKEIKSREYDRQFVDGAGTDDLDIELVKIVADQLLKGMSPEKCLQYLDLAEYATTSLRLKRAAILLFSKDPIKWHPRLQVRILRVDGDALLTGEFYNVTSDTTITGNILTLVDRAWEALRPHLIQTKFDKNARFEQKSIYPELACREALLNSIAHRDYADEGRCTEVFVFSDHLEIRNPGALLSSIKIEDLISQKGVHQSRNTHVARVLRELGYMRELGEGMRRIFDLMHRNELAPPHIEDKTDGFSITLNHKPMYSPKDMLWLSQFDHIDLSREQKTVILLGQEGNIFSPKDVWDAVGIVDTEDYRILIAGLKEINALVSKVTRNQAQALARKNRIPVKEYPRFGISIPQNTGKSPIKNIEHNRKNREIDNSIASEINDKGKRLFIGNLPLKFDRDRLYDIFSSHGNITELHIPNMNGKNRGFAFLDYDTHEAANAVLDLNEEIIFSDRKLIIRWAASGRRNIK